MPSRLMPFAIFLLPLSACSTPNPPAADAAPLPAAMIRPACTPPDTLMASPKKLAALPDALSEQAALQSWLDDMQAYQQLRDQTGALQAFVRQSCE